ncbi:MAG TPA: hypothetical protein VGM68_12570 [Rhizomicrobium sp.]
MADIGAGTALRGDLVRQIAICARVYNPKCVQHAGNLNDLRASRNTEITKQLEASAQLQDDVVVMRRTRSRESIWESVGAFSMITH